MRPLWLANLTAIAVALVALSGAGSPDVAWAQNTLSGCEEELEPGDEAAKFRKVTRGGETVYEYTGVIRVCGKVPKPNVVAILLEKTIGYEWEKLKKDFLPKIRASIKKAPF
jgi:hypothetical protein